MKITLIILFTLPLFFHTTAFAGDYAQQANENPFLHGKLNPKYYGEKTALQGEIIEIKSTTQNYPLYKLNLRTKDIKNIWVTSLSSPPEGQFSLGDMVVFKGFISTTNKLDPSGELRKIIHAKTLLLALVSKKVNE